MNKEQIATVERLRHEGKGPSAIAKETGISINTVKSHLGRHSISAPRRARTCMLCHSEIKTSKRFCSDACRAKWYESHRDEEQDILHVCKVCGALFEPRPAKQVYCSKQCFYNDRYHPKQNATEYEIDLEALQAIPREEATALVKMTMDYLLKSGWSPSDEENTDSLSAVIDAIYMQSQCDEHRRNI